MRAALAVEWIKFRRATTVRVTTVLVAILVPAMSAGFLAVVRSDSDGALAIKAAALLTDVGWAGITGFSAQIMSVGALLAVGVVVAWVFGREFTDRTFGALFAAPTSPGALASAKMLITMAWGVLVSCVAAVLTLAAGALIGLGLPDAEAGTGAVRIAVVGVLTVVLTLPLAVVASAARGYLPAISALLALVVFTQVVVALGAGAWFPYAAPGMWAGLGGASLAETVTPLQLLLALPIGAVSAAATWRWWQTAEVR
ncbi:ABC transporter permease [Microbacterium paraoxydans]|uniref:ABC transporter permease n=1 Tax=Microbacterium paraoxydans TaxID=199592 RepID=UPI001CFC2FA0|nr:ABC transporter permease [Microbacterium paraoxydans]